MANLGFNPLLDPATQAQIDRQRQYAQLLQQQSLTPNEGSMVSGHYVAPSWTQGLARMVQGYTAGKINKDTDAQQSAMWKNQMAMLSQMLSPTQSPQAGPSDVMGAGAAASPNDASGNNTGGVGPTTGNAQTLDAMPPTQPSGFVNQGSNNFNIANLLKSNAISSLGGDAAGSAFWKQYEPTDATRMAMAAGLDPRMANADTLHKNTYIPPTRLGEGAYADSSGNVQGLPSAAQPGFINQRNQQGQWETVPVGGGLQAISQSTAAKTEAESAGKIINVKDASGREVPMWAGQAVNGGQPTQSAPATGNFDLSTPQKVSALNQDIEKLKLSDPQQAAQVQAAADQQKFANIPKLAVPTGIGQSTYNQETQKSQAEAASKTQENLGSLANAANQKISLNNQALSLLDKSDIGPGASLSADLKSIIAKYVPGVSEASFQNTPSATLALQKDLLNAATAKAKAQFGARITQQEVQLMLSKGSPNVNMPKAAIQYLIQSDNAAANYDIQKANDFGKYMSNGGDPYQFDGWYAKNFPLANDTAQVHLKTPQATPAPQQQAPQVTKTINGKTYVKINGQWHEGQ
jgi:hypothetical protein